MIGVSSVCTTLVRDAVEAPPAVSHILRLAWEFSTYWPPTSSHLEAEIAGVSIGPSREWHPQPITKPTRQLLNVAAPVVGINCPRGTRRHCTVSTALFCQYASPAARRLWDWD